MPARKTYWLGYVFMSLIALTVLGFTQCQSRAGKRASESLHVAPPAPTHSASTFGLTTAIAQVARRNIPAVVHIDVTESREISNPMLPFGNDPFFRFFFNGSQTPRKFKQELKGLGTGMLIDSRGDILTNNHVVAGATDINVLLASGKSYPATLVGADPKTDLAVIRISADKKLPNVTFGDSDKMEVGDWVVAIGHPRGLDQTVTQGIISAKHRHGVLDPSSYQDFLQTDAAINPGNSGGPLLNLNGQVIGVNAAIATQSGGFEGIGFAIPSNIAVHVAQALIAHGRVERGYLGVSIRDVTPEMVACMHLKNNKGALVTEVINNSPAQRAGLKKNDLISTYEGQSVDGAAFLQSRVADTSIGQKVNLTVLRDGKTLTMTVKIGSLEHALHKIATSLENRLGVVVRPLTADEIKKYGLQPNQGVALESVTPHGLLGKAGFEKGDVILEINNIPVEGVQSFVELAKSLPPRRQVWFKALDHRTGQTGYVQVQMG